MRLTGELRGLDEALRKTAAMVRVGQRKWRDAVEFVLKELEGYAKQNRPPAPGAYRDRTGLLRQSIGYEMDPSGAPSGILFAGMKYAIFVERLENYWVLQGAIDFYRPKIDEIFRGRIRIKETDLEKAAREATIYYRELRKRERRGI